MIGIRELRSDLAAHVRRAAAGEATVVTVDGHPSALLGPVSAAATGGITRAALIASGGLLPPRRGDGTLPTATVAVWGNARLDRLLREVRG